MKVLITIRNSGWQGLLLKLAWGPRRVSSKYQKDSSVYAYPREVTASHRLWFIWIFRGKDSGLLRWLRGDCRVVFPNYKAEKRILDSLPLEYSSKTECKKLKGVVNKEEISKLIEKRNLLREQKNFAEADKIRDLLISYGEIVMDSKVKLTERKEI
jgi:hypothetical protein